MKDLLIIIIPGFIIIFFNLIPDIICISKMDIVVLIYPEVTKLFTPAPLSIYVIPNVNVDSSENVESCFLIISIVIKIDLSSSTIIIITTNTFKVLNIIPDIIVFILLRISVVSRA